MSGLTLEGLSMDGLNDALDKAAAAATHELRAEVAADETVDGELVRSVDDWVRAIKADLGRAVEGIVSAGRNLIAAKAEVGHGHWLPMLKQIGISEAEASRLRTIAEKVGNLPNLEALPSSVSTLYELAHVEDLQESVESGDVTPQTTAKDAKKLKEQKQANAERVTAIRDWADVLQDEIAELEHVPHGAIRIADWKCE